MPLDPEHRSQQPAEHYHPGTHITAGALRRNKLHVPSNVPDRAWIRKDAVRTKTAQRLINGVPSFYLTADFLQPFTMTGGPGNEDDGDPFRTAYAAAAEASQGAVLLGPKGAPITGNHGGAAG
jgi:hypothetical protein